MINGDLHRFVDDLSQGAELWVLYKGKEYFIQGWQRSEDGLYTIFIEIDPEDLPEGQDVLWEHVDDEMEKCAEAFLAAPIWDGKTFWEVEAEMTWLD